jgi:hypothetical protein
VFKVRKHSLKLKSLVKSLFAGIMPGNYLSIVERG